MSHKSELRDALFVIDTEGMLENIEERLGNLRDKAPKVLQKALNDTAKKTGRDLVKAAQERYRVKTIQFAKEIRYTYATQSRLTAVLQAKGSGLAASKFKLSPSKPTPQKTGSPAAKLAVLKKTGPRTIENKFGLNAFVAKFQSGHIALVQRRPPKKYLSKGWKERQQRWSAWRKMTGRLDNTKIKEFYGPSVPKMLEKTGDIEKFTEISQPKILGNLRNAITKHINTELYFANKK